MSDNASPGGGVNEEALKALILKIMSENVSPGGGGQAGKGAENSPGGGAQNNTGENNPSEENKSGEQEENETVSRETLRKKNSEAHELRKLRDSLQAEVTALKTQLEPALAAVKELETLKPQFEALKTESETAKTELSSMKKDSFLTALTSETGLSREQIEKLRGETEEEITEAAKAFASALGKAPKSPANMIGNHPQADGFIHDGLFDVAAASAARRAALTAPNN